MGDSVAWVVHVKNKPSFAQEFKRGAKASLPVLLGIIPFGLVFGAQAFQKGISVAEIALMTGLNFGGGSEFAAIEVWGTPIPVGLILAMTLLVNSRHLLMGAALAPYLQHLPLRKALPYLFFMCDESWALAMADAEKTSDSRTPMISVGFYLGVGLCLWVTWLIFPAVGGLVGSQIGDLRGYGFDMAFAAVFIVLLRGMWKGGRSSTPWLVSLSTAALFHLMVPGGWYVLAGVVSGLTWAYLWME